MKTYIFHTDIGSFKWVAGSVASKSAPVGDKFEDVLGIGRNVKTNIWWTTKTNYFLKKEIRLLMEHFQKMKSLFSQRYGWILVLHDQPNLISSFYCWILVLYDQALPGYLGLDNIQWIFPLLAIGLLWLSLTWIFGSETIFAAITSLFQSSLFASIPRANSILAKSISVAWIYAQVETYKYWI